KSARFHEAPDLAHDSAPLREDFAGPFVSHEIEITLPVARLDIRQAMPFLGQWPQSFREYFEMLRPQCRLASFGEKTTAFDANEIAEVQQREDFHRFRSEFLCLHVDLDASGRV